MTDNPSIPAATPVEAKVKFSEVCGLLEKLQKKSSADAKKDLLRDFIDKWRKFQAVYDSENNPSKEATSFYPVMRLLLPKLDTERPAYGIKENTLAKHYIEIFGLGKDSPDAKKLLNYRAPVSSTRGGGGGDVCGDFAAVAYHVLQHRLAERGTLTVSDVNRLLDSIALGNITNKKEAVKSNLSVLSRSLGPIESKWIMRIILKDMKIGMSESSIFSVFHSDAEQLFNVTSSLKRVCVDLKDPNKTLGEIEVKLFSPFRPMLADRVLTSKVIQSIKSNTFYIETKMDGERMQLHKDGSNFRYFSRSSKDFTSCFGATDVTGSFTPHIANAFKSNVKSCILDGEMMVFSTELQQFVTKGQKVDVKHVGKTTSVESSSANTMTRSKFDSDDEATTTRMTTRVDGLDVNRVKEDKNKGLLQCFVVFDILYLNGKVLSASPLHQRLAILKDVFQPITERLRFVEQRLASTQDDVMNALNDAIENHEEGIIVKHPESVYKADKRKESGWYKIKPDYENNIMSDLDLVVVGGFYGSGRRSNIISKFLLAIADSVHMPDSNITARRYDTIVKIGSGYTDLELKEVLTKLDPHWKRTKPDNVRVSREKAEVWIEPEMSVVICVRAAELIVSDKYFCGYTLRFPRVESIRSDKDCRSILTKTELNDLWQTYQGKLATNYSLGDSIPVAAKRKPRAAKRKLNQPITLDERFKPADFSHVDVKSELFDSREFCVISVPSNTTKSDLETLIVKNGGRIVQNANRETFCVVTDKVNLRVNNLIKADTCDVVHTEWIVDCVEKKEMTTWLPEQMFYVCTRTQPLFEQEYGKNFKIRTFTR